MARFITSFRTENSTLPLNFNSDDPRLKADFNGLTIIPEKKQSDWDQTDTTQSDYIKNKPTINDVELHGNVTSEDLKIIYRGTTAYWDAKRTLISELNAIYVYTDYKTVDNKDGTYTIYPGVKIGDGTSYLIDMPFMAADDPRVIAHIENDTIHVTASEKEFWNNKWSGYVDENNPENLCFTKDLVILGGTIHV